MMLDNHPDDFFLLQIHLAGTYEIYWGGTTRANFYGVTGTPIAWTDGVREDYGGTGNTAQDYARYNASYNARKAVPTDVTIDLVAKETGSWVYDVRATVCVEPAGTGKTVRIYMAEVLDNWPSWPTYSRNTLRQAVNLKEFTIAAGECAEVVHRFTFYTPEQTSPEDIKIIAWAQEPLASAPAEVHQAGRMTWPFPSAPCEPLAVRSYREHGAAGELYLDLGISDGIEPRVGGIVELEVDLDDAWGFTGGVTVNCDPSWPEPPGTVSVTGPIDDTVTLEFDPALPNESYCTIQFDCGAEVCVTSCDGDMNLDGGTNTTDASSVKLRFGQTLTDANCEWDFNTDGAINTTDYSQVKLRFGNIAPSCP